MHTAQCTSQCIFHVRWEAAAAAARPRPHYAAALKRASLGPQCGADASRSQVRAAMAMMFQSPPPSPPSAYLAGAALLATASHLGLEVTDLDVEDELEAVADDAPSWRVPRQLTLPATDAAAEPAAMTPCLGAGALPRDEGRSPRDEGRRESVARGCSGGLPLSRMHRRRPALRRPAIPSKLTKGVIAAVAAATARRRRRRLPRRLHAPTTNATLLDALGSAATLAWTVNLTAVLAACLFTAIYGGSLRNTALASWFVAGTAASGIGGVLRRQGILRPWLRQEASTSARSMASVVAGYLHSRQSD